MSAVATMGKSKSDEGEPLKKRSVLNVSPEAHRIVTKVATHRGLKIEEFFDEKDVREFFTHLLLEEMRKEELRLKGKR